MIFRLELPADDHVAILQEDREALTFGSLRRRVIRAGEELRRLPRGLVLLVTQNHADFVVAYLACLESGYPLLLVEPGPSVAALVSAYQPGIILIPHGMASSLPTRETQLEQDFLYALHFTEQTRECHSDLAVLLQTSGSTGSPKLVRLSRSNLEANARSISAYLDIDSSQRAVQSLPFSYSYGLSVLNSHLYAGASVLLSEASFMRPEFWQRVDQWRCTSFAGVPFMYETLQRLRFNPAKHPSLRTYTQAGGGLVPATAAHFAAVCPRFFVMYGQTEATARISYVPPERLKDKPGSIGVPIPEGRLEVREGQLIYSGPNVMMGYAETPQDLLRGDELQGELATGDLGYRDEEGFFYISGRLKRFAKLFGSRINLDDVEGWLEQTYPVQAACLEIDNRLFMFLAPLCDCEAVRMAAAAHLQLTPQAFVCRQVPQIPQTPAGKKIGRP